jgi:alpha-glucoside transport system substrate-binding protein
MTKSLPLLITILLVAAMPLACRPGAPAPESPTAEQATATVAATVVPSSTPATPAADQTPENPELVTLAHPWQGEQLRALEEVIAALSADTALEVELRPVPFAELRSQLNYLVAVDNPPHLALLPSAQLLAELAEQEALVQLGTILDVGQLPAEYVDSWLELGGHGNALYGLPLDIGIKSLVWYSPAAFAAAGYTVPTSWQAMMDLSQRMAAEGRSPWCIGIEHGEASGWAASDWIEDILLRSAGPEVYDRWVAHEIPWTDPAVERAWGLFGQIALNDELVAGGSSSILTTTWTSAVAPLFDDPPGCSMHHQGPWIATAFPPGLVIGQDIDFFPLPPIDSAHGTPMVTWASLLVMMEDTDQARSVMAYLASPPPAVQQLWSDRGWFLTPNPQVGPALHPDLYTDDLTRRVAETLFDASVVRFDGSDLMPEEVQQAFWRGTVEYIAGADLRAVLEGIEAVAAPAYR